MKLSKLMNTDLFSVLVSEHKDLYYDAIQMVEENTSNTGVEGMVRDRAREKIIEIIENDSEYNTREDGSKLNDTEIRDLAGRILLNLENKGWLNRKEEMLEKDRIYVSRAGNAILNGIKKLETKENNFEFKNALQRVYLIGKSYENRTNEDENIYISCLKEMYDNTIELRNNMYRFKNDFEELVKDLDQSMTPKELAAYIQEIATGTRMKNYNRIISSEDGAKAYESEILKTLKRIKVNDYEKFARAYREYEGIETMTEEESEYFITDLVSEMIPFYEDEYSDLKCEMSNVITNYLKKVNNKCKITFSDLLSNYDPTEHLLQLMGTVMEDSSDIYLPDDINGIFNLFDLSYFTIESLTHNTGKESTDGKIEPVEILKLDQESMEESFKSIQERNAKAYSKKKTIKFLKDQFPMKKQIDAKEFKVDSKDDYSFLLNLIRYASDESFPYQVELLEEEAFNSMI